MERKNVSFLEKTEEITLEKPEEVVEIVENLEKY